MPKTFSSCAPAKAARHRITTIVIVALVASTIFAADVFPSVIFPKIAAQISGFTSDKTVRMAWM